MRKIAGIILSVLGGLAALMLPVGPHDAATNFCGWLSPWRGCLEALPAWFDNWSWVLPLVFFGIAAVLLIWPSFQILRLLLDLLWAKNRIPILEAAQIAFEYAEKIGIEDLVSSTATPSSDKLNYFLYAFVTDDRIRLFGERSPSRVSREIPDNVRSRLHPIPGTSNLRSDFASEGTHYDKVTITKRDLFKYLKKLKSLAKQAI